MLSEECDHSPMCQILSKVFSVSNFINCLQSPCTYPCCRMRGWIICSKTKTKKKCAKLRVQIQTLTSEKYWYPNFHCWSGAETEGTAKQWLPQLGVQPMDRQQSLTLVLMLWYACGQRPFMVVLWDALSTQQLTETDIDTHTQALDWSQEPLCRK
jgi:hypothetical protein